MHLHFLSVLVLAVLAFGVLADVYLHSPRGSNNRLNEATRPRRNANRMFNSQNNQRGGYNVGVQKMSYHVGSILTIEWTNQHSCSGPNNNCELILQYMCGDKVRDGRVTTTIPESLGHERNYGYGMHEDYKYYRTCKQTSRNKGLFLADQQLKGSTAIYTRQQSQGTRYAFECPEERDYYPYWRPSPWKDIAVLTSNPSRCSHYKRESENVKGRYFCFIDLSSATSSLLRRMNSIPIPITKKDCEAFKLTERNKCLTGRWIQNPSHQEENKNIKAPDCLLAPQSRDNHLGNGKGGFPNTYNWTIPNDVNDKCVLRIRYNISTGDYPLNADGKLNGKYEIFGSQVGISDKDEAKKRNYILTGNPEVHPMKIGDDVIEKFELKLAINTAQFGRTFQDRSHVFAIRPRPSNIPPNVPIYNLNVRGKRGNIVQTYPAVEYDFVPNRLHIKKGDAIHIQWNGALTNPRNNAGQGRAGTDKSNIVQLTGPQYEAVLNAQADQPNKFGHWANSYPDHLYPAKFLGFTLADRKILAYNAADGIDKTGRLDRTSAYFNLGVRAVNKVGAHRYFCTRNNAFTNRGQKGVIIVHSGEKTKPKVGIKPDKRSSLQEDMKEKLADIKKLEQDVKRAFQSKF